VLDAVHGRDADVGDQRERSLIQLLSSSLVSDAFSDLVRDVVVGVHLLSNYKDLGVSSPFLSFSFEMQRSLAWDVLFVFFVRITKILRE
jgi:hypothetical protein